jgi:Lactate dehydrogenase and related dehydrogenases
MEEFQLDRVLCRASGYDNVDLEAANDLGILVQNAPDYGAESVAEYNLGLILGAAKRIFKDEGLKPNEDLGTRGRELKDKKLGVVGAGRIGKELLKRAKPFGMELLAFDPYEDPEAAEEIGYSYVGLEKLLEEADIVSINCPLNDSTKGLISSSEFELMEDVLFVNIARGEIIDTFSLLNALDNGIVDVAALDVVEEDGFELLKDREDVMITPHNAYNTKEAVKRRTEITLNNLDNEENVVNEF